MEYTINKFAHLSGVSVRTIRYYDQIDLLKPARVNSAGYRIYGEEQVNRMQQILFYKELGFDLQQIKESLDADDFSNERALQKHYQNLLKQRDNLNLLLDTVEKTIKYYRGEEKMSDEEKFAALKKQRLEENEQQYGQELAEMYDQKTIKAANKMYANLTQEQMNEMENIEAQLFEKLNELNDLSDVQNEAGKKAYELHKKWLSYTWPKYSPEAHCNLVEMYLADGRFADYYNQRANKNVAQLLHDAVIYYAKKN